MIAKLFFKISFVTFLISTGFWLLNTWSSPSINLDGKYYLDPESATQYKPDLEQKLVTDSGIIFKITQINNSPRESINTHFPIILIEPNVQIDGWLQIVLTDVKDCDNLQWKKFLDNDPKNYPFYSHLQYFYDAPL